LFKPVGVLPESEALERGWSDRAFDILRTAARLRGWSANGLPPESLLAAPCPPAFSPRSESSGEQCSDAFSSCVGQWEASLRPGPG
jgi:hypothetical protein